MPKQLTEHQVLLVALTEDDDEWLSCQTACAAASKASSRHSRIVFRPFRRVLSTGENFFDERREKVALEQCDFAVFVLPRAWKPSAGDDTSSRFVELWALAEQLYVTAALRDIALFLQVPIEERRDDVGEALVRLSFEGSFESARAYRSMLVSSSQDISTALENLLLRWVRVGRAAQAEFLGAPTMSPTTTVKVTQPPSFDYWLAEVYQLIKSGTAQLEPALFCASKAVGVSTSDIEWAKAKNALGMVQHFLNDVAGALSSFGDASTKLASCADLESLLLAGNAGFNRAVILDALGRDHDVLEAYEQLAARYMNAAEVPLCGLWAKILFKQAAKLKRLGQRATSIERLDAILSRFKSATEPLLLQILADALVEKSRIYLIDEDFERAMAINDEIASLFEHSKVPSLQDLAAKSLFDKGSYFGLNGRRDEEIAAYDNLAERFSGITSVVGRERLGSAMLKKAEALEALDRPLEQLATLTDVCLKFGRDAEVKLQYVCAEALTHQAIVLKKLGRSIEAIAVYDDAVERFQGSSDRVLRETAAECLFFKGYALKGLGREDDALLAYDDLIRRFGPNFDESGSTMVAYALLHRSAMVGVRGKIAEAISGCDEIIDRIGSDSPRSMDIILAAAMFNKTCHLDFITSNIERMEICDAIIRRFDGEKGLIECIVKAVFRKGVTLQVAGRDADALEVYDNALSRIVSDAPDVFEVIVPNILLNKAIIQARAGRNAEALALCESVLEKREGSSDAQVLSFAEKAERLRTSILREQQSSH